MDWLCVACGGRNCYAVSIDWLPNNMAPIRLHQSCALPRQIAGFKYPLDFMEKAHALWIATKRALKTQRRFATGFQRPFRSYPQMHKMCLYHKTHRVDDDELIYTAYRDSLLKN